MSEPVTVRRALTVVGVYGSAALGFAGTIVAARLLGADAFGALSVVLAAAGLFQLLLDLTAEESVVKFGFRYAEGGDWGRLRRLFALALGIKLAGGALASLAVLGLSFGADAVFDGSGLGTPMRIAALLPLVQAPETVAASALLLRVRYDVRGALLALTQALRLAALAVGAQYGVTEAVAGLVVAQAVSTGAIGLAGWLAFRRFPHAAAAALAEHRREIVRFVLQSSLATGIISLRGWLAPVLLGVVSNPTHVGYFRIAQAPMAGFNALSAPVRLILLAEQTRDWERGFRTDVLAGVRRYTLVASALMAVALPPLLVFMPDLVALVFGDEYRAAGNAARFVLAAAALHLVIGWSKPLPVAVGRPSLRVFAHGIETLVLVPVLVVLGALYDAAGAGAAVLASSAAFVATWAVIVVRLEREHAGPPPSRAPAPEPMHDAAP
jgi:O-antigen/teichoic acid export membrane protein